MKICKKSVSVMIKLGMTMITLVLFILGFGCSDKDKQTGATPGVTENGLEEGSYVLDTFKLVADPDFRGGFYLLDPKGGQRRIVAKLVSGEPSDETVWYMAQWNSRYSLKEAEFRELESGGVEYVNEANRVIINPGESELILGVNSYIEYDGRARTKPQDPWVHLLVEQDFDVDNAPSLAEMEAVNFTITARLNHSERYHSDNYSTGLHAAQFLIHFIVQNRNPGSRGYGDFYWFGIPLYDDRYTFAPRYEAQDFAVQQGKFIFTPGTKAYTDKSFNDGEWVTIEKNVLPFILEGLNAAWEKGYLKDSRNLDDYFISNMNMGWEVPGLFNVEMHVRHLDIEVVWRRPES